MGALIRADSQQPHSRTVRRPFLVVLPAPPVHLNCSMPTVACWLNLHLREIPLSVPFCTKPAFCSALLLMSALLLLCAADLTPAPVSEAVASNAEIFVTSIPSFALRAQPPMSSALLRSSSSLCRVWRSLSSLGRDPKDERIFSRVSQVIPTNCARGEDGIWFRQS